MVFSHRNSIRRHLYKLQDLVNRLVDKDPDDGLIRGDLEDAPYEDLVETFKLIRIELEAAEHHLFTSKGQSCDN